ncbi:hypothetical protein EON63_07415 [archaeon]|nr:MAG: hypothetical protein EON63_07415 [archaeon]
MNNPRATSPSPEPLARSSSHVEQSVESEGSRFVSHRKMLGWKLTSVSKRKELLELLDVLTHQQGKQRQHVLSPVGRKKQLLLNQLEQELLSTSQSMLLSPPKDLSQLHHASLDAVTRSSSRSLVHRQSEALEKYLSRSLQSKLSYKTKVGIDFQMKERKMVKDLLHGIKTPASALRPITPSQPHGLQEPYGGIYTAYDDGQHLAQPSIQEEMTAHSQGILALTMQVFPQPSRPSSTDPLLLRPASRFINTRSRQSPSRGKSRQSSNSRRSRSRSREKKDNVKQEVSKVIYDLPYNLHRPIDRMVSNYWSLL